MQFAPSGAQSWLPMLLCFDHNGVQRWYSSHGLVQGQAALAPPLVALSGTVQPCSVAVPRFALVFHVPCMFLGAGSNEPAGIRKEDSCPCSGWPDGWPPSGPQLWQNRQVLHFARTIRCYLQLHKQCVGRAAWHQAGYTLLGPPAVCACSWHLHAHTACHQLYMVGCPLASLEQALLIARAFAGGGHCADTIPRRESV